MIRVFMLWILFILYWNHKIYRIYMEITRETLFYKTRSRETNKGWIP